MPAKYDHISFKPPTSVAKAAKRGLKMRSKQSKSNQGGTAVGLARANQLAKRETLSPSTVKRMKAFFDRHQKNKKVDSGKKAGADKGQQAWLLWGGDAGRGWSAKKVRQMEAADKKKSVKRANNPCGMGKGGLFTKSNYCATGNPNQGKKSKAKAKPAKAAKQSLPPVKAEARRKEQRKAVDSMLNSSAVRTQVTKHRDIIEEIDKKRKLFKEQKKKVEEWRDKIRNGDSLLPAKHQKFWGTRDFERIRNSLDKELGVFEGISPERKAELNKVISQYEAEFKVLDDEETRLRMDLRKTAEVRDHARDMRQVEYRKAVQRKMMELNIGSAGWLQAVPFNSDWEEYRFLREQYAAVSSFTQDLNAEMPILNDWQREELSPERLQVYSEEINLRTALLGVNRSEKQELRDKMKEVRERLDDGDQGRLSFDDGQRGQGLGRIMRRMWHEERIEGAREQSRAMSKEFGLLPLFEGDRNEEQAAKALQLFKQQELIDRYKREYRAFKDKEYGGSNQYFDEAENTTITLENSYRLQNKKEQFSPQENLEKATAFFESQGLKIFEEDIATLGGLGDDSRATVTVTEVAGTGEPAIELLIRDGYKAERMMVVEDGEIIMHNKWFRVFETGQGLGSEIFARQVQAAREAGVSKLECLAARSSEMNGYITWAKFGYDGRIPPDIRPEVEDHFGESITTIQQLMATAGGMDWWQEHGVDWYATFDLDPDSYSSRHFESYLKRKGIYEGP